MSKTMSRGILKRVVCAGALCATFAAAASMTLTSCSEENTSETTNQTEESMAVANPDIKTVMDAHVDELMKMQGVVMVAIGQLEDKTPCITIYAKEKTAEMSEKIPADYEGHPVKFEISDEIKPMSGG